MGSVNNPSDNDNGSDEPPSNKNREGSSPWSFFGSLLDNDNSQIKDEIHQQLNDLEGQREQYLKEQERRRKEFMDKYKHVFDGYDSAGEHSGGRDSESPRHSPTHPAGAPDMHQELQDFFEAAMGGGGLFGPSNEMFPPNGRMSSSSSSSVRQWGSSTSYRLRQDSRSGAHLEVQLPKGTQSKDVAVHVLQEYPCHIQWEGIVDENNKKSGWGLAGPRQRQGSQQEGRRFREQVRLGEGVDCSQLSAQLDQARNVLTVRAPVQDHQASQRQPVRSIPVTERNF